MQKKYLFLCFCLLSSTLLAQSPDTSLEKKKKSSLSDFFRNNKEEEGSVVYLNVRFGAKLFKPIYKNISYNFEREAIATPFSGNVLLPEGNYMRAFEASAVQLIFRNNLILDVNVGYAWRERRKETGGLENWIIAPSIGYQIRLLPKSWLRGTIQIGYGESRQQIARWVEDDERYELSIRQGQVHFRPEVSFVKVFGDYAGAALSLNLGYDMGFFRKQSVRLSDIDIDRRRSFEEYNLQYQNRTINKIGFNPNNLIFSIGIGFYVSDLD